MRGGAALQAALQVEYLALRRQTYDGSGVSQMGRVRRPAVGAKFARCAIVLMLGSIAVAGGAARAEPLPREQQAALLQQAQGYFDQGVNTGVKDPAGARELFRQSEAAFREVIASGAENAGVEYNAGNAAFRAGNVGGAILHLRRAIRLAPAAKDIRANLDYVRERVTPQVKSAGETQFVRTALGWHYATSLGARWWTAAGAGVLGWALLFAWTRRRGGGLFGIACAAIAISAAASGSLLWQLHFEYHTPEGVVIAQDQVLRVGRGDGYEPALREPLGPGVELRVLETRGDWLRVELASGVIGWLPANAVERV